MFVSENLTTSKHSDRHNYAGQNKSDHSSETYCHFECVINA